MPANHYYNPATEVTVQRGLYFHSLVINNKNGENDKLIIELLEQNKNLVSFKYPNGCTPLQHLMLELNSNVCTLSDFKKTASILIKHGADSNVQETFGAHETLLHRLVLTNVNGENNEDISNLLKSKNVLVNAKSGQGLSALQALMNLYARQGCTLSDFRNSAALLIIHGADLTVKDSTARNTLLHWLCEGNKEGVNDVEIKLMLREHANLCEIKNGNGLTPLQSVLNQASHEGHSIIDFRETAMLLVESGANFTVKDTLTRNTLLHHLILKNKDGCNDEQIKKILRLNKDVCHLPNGNNVKPLEALISQFSEGHCSLRDFKHNVLLLAVAGVHFSPVKSLNYSREGVMNILLSQNARNENDAEIAKLLEQNPDLANQKDSHNEAPLQFLINQLLKGKISLDSFKKTASILTLNGAEPSLLLHALACKNKNGVNDKEIKALIEKFPDLVNQKDKFGYTALQAVIYDNENATIENVKLLIELGCDIAVVHHKIVSLDMGSVYNKFVGHESSDRCRRVRNLLEAACVNGNLPVAKLLVDKGLLVSKINVMDCFPQEQDENFWDWLHANGANVGATDLTGKTLLHYAACDNNTSLAAWLTSKKVDLNIMDENAETALNCAQKKDAKRVASLLIKAGARPSSLNELYSSIKMMREYGIELKNRGEIKGEVAMDLADQLQKKASILMQDEKVDLVSFKKGFTELLNSKNHIMSEYRIHWMRIVENILIALTGIGSLLLLGHLAYTKAMTGRALCFFQKPRTTSEEKIAQVGRSLAKIGA